MTDQEFLDQLEACTLPESEFGHVGHVRAGFAYVQRYTFGVALDRMKDSLIQYARSLGREGRYHDTITVAFLALIQERLASEPTGITWETFAVKHEDLLDRGLLSRFYSAEVLESAEARAVFRLPRPRG